MYLLHYMNFVFSLCANAPYIYICEAKGLALYKLQEFRFSRTFAGDCLNLDQYGISGDMTRGQHAV